MIEIFSIIKDTALIISSITAAVVAIKGLNVWKKQMRGNKEYNLIIKIFASLYEMRDLINILVNIMKINDAVQKNKGYKNKISENPFREALSNFGNKVTEQKVAFIEVEALWGKDIRRKFEPYFTIIYKVIIAMNYYIYSYYEDAIQEEKDLQIISQAKDCLCGELEDFIKEIESYLKEKM